MDLGLKGKTALVLGGSRGLGFGVARAILAEGARVVIASRSESGLVAARDALPTSDRDRCFTVAAELGIADAPPRIVEQARSAVGPIDILVNNGGGPSTGQPSAVTLLELDENFDRMVRSQIAVTLALLPAMRQRRWGRILTIASSGVIQPIPHLPVSNSLRAALVTYMKTLANEVAKDGVTVNVLAPGRVATDRTSSIDAARASRDGRSIEAVATESAATIPAGRYGTIEEFGAVAAFLASVGASYVTGSVIRVDGGAIRSV